MRLCICSCVCTKMPILLRSFANIRGSPAALRTETNKQRKSGERMPTGPALEKRNVKKRRMCLS